MSSSHCIECPQCKRIPNKQNRLISEICGHYKCRLCFLYDEADCLQCMHNMGVGQKLKITVNKSQEDLEKVVKLVVAKVISSESETRKRKIDAACASIPPCNIKNQQSPDGFMEYYCTICNKHFSRTEQYYHLACANDENKKYICKICEKKFSSRSHLNYHMESHEGNCYKCKKCGKTFDKLAILQKHEKHHEELSVRCPECNKEFKHQSSLDAHLAKHNNDLSFACEYCDHKYTTNSLLQQHMLKHFDKKHQCNQCGQKFQRHSSLTLHMRRHSETESHSCSICKKVFKDAGTLFRHSDTHTGMMKYKCTECDLKSLRKDTILRHARVIHHKDPKSCVEILKYEEPPVLPLDLTIVDTLEEQFSELSCEENQMELESPKTVENSSVIKCVGNVEPVLVPSVQIETSSDKTPAENVANTTLQLTTLQNIDANTYAAIMHKKLRKKYDPIEMYRKILSSAEEANQLEINSRAAVAAAAASAVTVTTAEVVAPSVVKPVVQRQRSQSNFSETHWRKNFKYTYQYQNY